MRWGVPATGRTPHNRYGGPPLAKIPALALVISLGPPVRTRLISLVLSLVRQDVPAYHCCAVRRQSYHRRRQSPSTAKARSPPDPQPCCAARSAFGVARSAQHTARQYEPAHQCGPRSLCYNACAPISGSQRLMRTNGAPMVSPQSNRASTAQSTGTTVVATVLTIRISVSARNAFGVLAATIIVSPECAVRNRTLVPMTCLKDPLETVPCPT